jgi:photosystem II stability/assembly factor-like uncharacterized protein
MKRLSLLLIIAIAIMGRINAQTIELVQQGTASSFRGLSVVDDRVVWVSGSNGTVGRSIDSGRHFTFIRVTGYEKTDFRDIEAFDDMTAIIMGIDCPAHILKTIDGGKSWKLVFKDTTKGMFLDAMTFWNEQSGIVIGDPIDGRLFVGRTFDGGEHWQTIPMEHRPQTNEGEACFASSGTNVCTISNEEAIIITGGKHSALFKRDTKITLPVKQGTESAGANSIAAKNKRFYMIVGGDFNTREDTTGNAVYTPDAGKTWLKPLSPPTGYRSCVEYLSQKTWMTCGLNGVDISYDDGVHFQKISDTGFHVCRKAKKGKTVFLAGGGGRIGIFRLP